MTGVSVVIPTLGGPSLSDTITRVNEGTCVPDEVIVCIPEREAPLAAPLASAVVRILPTPVRGQVAQRAEGFRAARSAYVLQLDDDIWLERDCLAHLVKYLESNPGTAVGPALHDRTTGEYRSFLVPQSPKPTRTDALMFRVINGAAGYQPGQISRAGVNMGLPETGDFQGLGWLPGGCILHHRTSLELSAFYPFPGKAFAEDLFHSHLLTRAGVLLARCGAARCSVDFASSKATSYRRAAHDYLEYGRRMRFFAREIGGSPARLNAFLALNVSRLLMRRPS